MTKSLSTHQGTLNILGIDYGINKIDVVKLGLSGSTMGRWVESESLILINELLNEQQVNATLWHESVHVVLNAIGESALGDNEDFVEKLSRAFMQIADLKIQKVNDENI
jgi:Zn-dependent peptidase ImmA (M78 family)